MLPGGAISVYLPSFIVKEGLSEWYIWGSDPIWGVGFLEAWPKTAFSSDLKRFNICIDLCGSSDLISVPWLGKTRRSGPAGLGGEKPQKKEASSRLFLHSSIISKWLDLRLHRKQFFWHNVDILSSWRTAYSNSCHPHFTRSKGSLRKSALSQIFCCADSTKSRIKRFRLKRCNGHSLSCIALLCRRTLSGFVSTLGSTPKVIFCDRTPSHFFSKHPPFGSQWEGQIVPPQT